MLIHRLRAEANRERKNLYLCTAKIVIDFNNMIALGIFQENS